MHFRSTTNNFLVEVLIFYLLNLATLLRAKARRKVRTEFSLVSVDLCLTDKPKYFGIKGSALSSSSFKSSPKDMFYCVLLLLSFVCF